MADTELQKAAEAGQAGAQLQEKEGQKDVSKLLASLAVSTLSVASCPTLTT